MIVESKCYEVVFFPLDSLYPNFFFPNQSMSLFLALFCTTYGQDYYCIIM